MNLTDQSVIEGAGVILSIFAIIFLIRKGWKMYTVLLIAIIILAITNGNSFLLDFRLLLDSVSSYTAFYLVTMVTTIVLLGNLHHKIGAMENFVSNLRFLIRDSRALLIIFPATISLFSTVPGGAIISAPMVDETGRELNMSPVELAMSNMIYRHLFVLINPFTSSLILASGITGISIASFLGFTIPIMAIAFSITTIFLILRYPKPESKTQSIRTFNESKRAIMGLLIAASPYLVAITLGLAFGVFFPLALLIGIVACFASNLPAENLSGALRERMKIFIGGLNWPIILSTLAIVVFKDFMLEAESFQQAVHYLVNLGLPLMVLVLALPFITGFITGNNTASLGISLPVLIPFLTPDLLTVRYFGLVYFG